MQRKGLPLGGKVGGEGRSDEGLCSKRKKQEKTAQTQQQSQKPTLVFCTKIKIGIEKTRGKRSKNEKNEDCKLPIKILQKTY